MALLSYSPYMTADLVIALYEHWQGPRDWRAGDEVKGSRFDRVLAKRTPQKKFYLTCIIHHITLWQSTHQILQIFEPPKSDVTSKVDICLFSAFSAMKITVVPGILGTTQKSKWSKTTWLTIQIYNVTKKKKKKKKKKTTQKVWIINV